MHDIPSIDEIILQLIASYCFEEYLWFYKIKDNVDLSIIQIKCHTESRFCLFVAKRRCVYYIKKK